MEETDTTEEKQRPWLFKKGQSGNPNGRPKGSISLKTFAKKYIQELTDAEKMEFLDGLPKIEVWKMAEGMAKQDIENNTTIVVASKENQKKADALIDDFLNIKKDVV